MVKRSTHKKRKDVGSVARTAGAQLTFFLTDSGRLPNPTATISKLPIGSYVVVRDYDHPDRADIALSIASLCNQYGHHLAIAVDLDLARALGAAALHLPEHKISDRLLISRARAAGLKISAACHSRSALKRAADAGFDFALVSPVFQTDSHVGVRCLGVHALARLVNNVPVPVIALGGVNLHTAGKLRAQKLAGIAGISGIV